MSQVLSRPERGGKVGAGKNEVAESLAAGLEARIGELRAVYARLHELADEHHEAIRRADTRGIALSIGAQNEMVQRISTVEKIRSGIAEALAKHLGWDGKGEITIDWIVQRLGGGLAERLAEEAARLRASMQALMQKNAVIRAAAEALAQHMEGLRRVMLKQLNHAKTYGCAGRMDAGPVVVSSLDLRS